jgi:hypothetical protein
MTSLFPRHLCHFLVLTSWAQQQVAAGSYDLLGKLVNRAEGPIECRSKGIWNDCFSGIGFSQSKCTPQGEAPDLPPTPFHWKTKFSPTSDDEYCIDCCSNSRLEHFFVDETWDLRCGFSSDDTIDDFDLYQHDFWFPVRGNTARACATKT